MPRRGAAYERCDDGARIVVPQRSPQEARFPADFMFRLSREEAEALVSQNVIPSKRSLGARPVCLHPRGRRHLSSVLRSERPCGWTRMTEPSICTTTTPRMDTNASWWLDSIDTPQEKPAKSGSGPFFANAPCDCSEISAEKHGPDPLHQDFAVLLDTPLPPIR